MAKHSPAKPSASGDQNLLWAVIALIGCSFVASVGVYVLTNQILDALASSNSMAMLITDAGVKSDDAKLEHQLTSATLGLMVCRDLGLALALGCFGCAVGVGIRLTRSKAS